MISPLLPPYYGRGRSAWRGGAFVVVVGCVVSVRLSLLFSVSRSSLGSCLLPNVTHPFFLFTLYIYLQDFKHSHPTSLDAPSSPASVATRSLESSLAFVHALYYFERLRPLQPLTGRRRRCYPNSTFKSDFPLHNSKSVHRRTHTRTHARTDAKRFYYLFHAICYSYGADN